MGKFTVKGDKEKMKVAAQKTKEKAQSSNSKRKEAKSSFVKTWVHQKKPKISYKKGVESSKHSIPSSSIIELTEGKGKGVAEATGATQLNLSSLRLPSFFGEIAKAFSKPVSTKSADANLDIE